MKKNLDGNLEGEIVDEESSSFLIQSISNKFSKSIYLIFPINYKKIEDTLNIFLLEKIKENINLKKNIDESRKSIQEESLKK